MLPPQRTAEWRTPSQAQWKNAFGNENRTRFSITARLHDGHVAWRGRFDDREDCNAFLWALARDELIRDRELWDLPTPAWHPDIGYGAPVQYAIVTVALIVSGTSWNVPLDCNGITGLTGEFIDTIGAGGSGGAGNSSGAITGGGGGAWSRITSLALTPSSVISLQVGVGGASRVVSGASFIAGIAGTATYFNGTSLAGSSVGAAPGGGGPVYGIQQNSPGTAGGAAASGVGALKNNGGRSGNISNFSSSGTGGGGAAGPNGVGNPGGDTASTTPTAGGAGDAGLGGSGGAASTANPATATAGGAGTEYGTHGSGGGGGGAANTGAVATGGGGGSYGGGGGGCLSGAAGATSGAGGQGLIVVAYTPAANTLPRKFDIHRRRRV